MWTRISLQAATIICAIFLVILSEFQRNPDALIIGPEVMSFPHFSHCSRKCESGFCSVPPLLRYGKYCGIGYSGCSGEAPCDGLDACCQAHDCCIQYNHDDYLNVGCNQGLVDCIESLRQQNEAGFPRSRCNVHRVSELITKVMKAAIIAGKALPPPHP